jgi:hypothetical protein
MKRSLFLSDAKQKRTTPKIQESSFISDGHFNRTASKKDFQLLVRIDGNLG